MAKKQKTSGGGNRKKGRNKKSHAMIRYVAEGRLARNKARNIARETRRQAHSL